VRFERTDRDMRGASQSPRSAWLLLLLGVLTAGLILAWPDITTARALFQSPVPTPGVSGQTQFQSPVRTPSQSPLATQIPRVFPTQQVQQPTFAPPTLTPAPTRTPAPTPTATALPAAAKTATAVAMTFLPPPTLTSPGIMPPSIVLEDPLSAPTSPVSPRPEATPTPVPQPTGLLGLFNNGLLLIGYLWLCCGAVVLAGVAIGAVWLLRKRM
jgi:hypothetical protein